MNRAQTWAPRAVIGTLVFALAGCSVITHLVVPSTQPPVSGASRFEPPEKYTTFWKTLEGCARIKGNYKAIAWFKADSVTVDGTDYNAYWFGKWNRVVIRSDRLDNDATIKHEMMHALIQNGGHPATYFSGRCGNLG